MAGWDKGQRGRILSTKTLLSSMKQERFVLKIQRFRGYLIVIGERIPAS